MTPLLQTEISQAYKETKGVKIDWSLIMSLNLLVSCQFKTTLQESLMWKWLSSKVDWLSSHGVTLPLTTLLITWFDFDDDFMIINSYSVDISLRKVGLTAQTTQPLSLVLIIMVATHWHNSEIQINKVVSKLYGCNNTNGSSSGNLWNKF